MFDVWLKEDIKDLFEGQDYDRVVVIDTGSDILELLKDISKKLNAEYFSVNDDISELKTKYNIEKNCLENKVLIHSIRSLDEMKFCREYAATGGCIAENLARYIRNKLGFDITISDKELITAGRESVGKGEKYWQKLFVDKSIFSKTDLLKFLKNPEDFERDNKKSMDVFLNEMAKYSLHDTKNKPVKTVAKEIANSIFATILTKDGNDHFTEIYDKWLQTRGFERSLKQYANEFSDFEDIIDFITLNPNHPFSKLDGECLELVLEKFVDADIDAPVKEFINQRRQSIASSIIETNWWSDVYTLCFLEIPEITQIESLDDFIIEYKDTLWKLDCAFRNLYSKFNGKRDVTNRLQSIYNMRMLPYLNRWFEFFKSDYKENQSDLIKNILENCEKPIVIIMGDAISLSIGNEIRNKLDPSIECSLKVVRVNIPSETATTMSALFSCGEDVLKTRKERHARLTQALDCKIEFDELDKFWGMNTSDSHLILYAGDIDQLGEKQGISALKYYDNFIKSVKDKISFLLNNGYSEVHLISDHGFIIYGNLSEADKTEDTLPIIKETKERYIIASEKIDSISKDWGFVEKPGVGYIYYKKNFSPFKTTGRYDFAHGGMTPQELLTPHLICSLKGEKEGKKIKVSISDRSHLENLVGDNFVVKLQGQKDVEGIRKVEINIKDNKDLDKTSDIITINAGQEIAREYNIIQANFKIIILDATTKETLDKINVKKQSARDFGGLL